MAIAVSPGMGTGIVADIQPKIARCRLVLSLVAIVAVYVDPTAPTLMPWLHLTGGGFGISQFKEGLAHAVKQPSRLVFA